MPIQADLDHPDGVIRTKVLDPVRLQQIRAHLKTLRETRSFQYPELVDARDLSGMKLSMDELKAIARAARNTLGHAPVADRAVIVKGERAFRKARVVSALTAGWMRLGVFDRSQDAENWLVERKEWALPASSEWREDRL
jgi:hypothetical protein